MLHVAYIPPAYRGKLVELAEWAGKKRYSFDDVLIELARQRLRLAPEDMRELEDIYDAARYPLLHRKVAQRTAKLATDVDVLTSSIASVLRRHERTFRKTNLEVASYALARDLNAVVAKSFVGPAFRPFSVTTHSACSLEVQVRGPHDVQILTYVPKGCADGPVGWSHDPDELIETLMQHDATAAKRHNAAEAFLAAVLRDSQDAGFDAVPKARTSVQVLFPGDVYATFDYLDAKTVHLTYFIAYSPAKGAGGTIMQFITDLADQHCVTLSLTADPLDLSHFDWSFAKMNTRAKPIPVEKLRRFYERFGFRSYRDSKDFVRTPRC